MYICICNAVTEREIVGAYDLGCRTLRKCAHAHAPAQLHGQTSHRPSIGGDD